MEGELEQLTESLDLVYVLSIGVEVENHSTRTRSWRCHETGDWIVLVHSLVDEVFDLGGITLHLGFLRRFNCGGGWLQVLQSSFQVKEYRSVSLLCSRLEPELEGTSVVRQDF